MPIGFKNPASSASTFSKSHRLVTTTLAIVVLAGLFAFGIAAPSLNNDAQVQAQSGNSACAEPPVEPRNVEFWGRDGGVLVQWDTCRDHRYEIRWRQRGVPVDDPFHWPNTTSAGRDGLFDIPDDTLNIDNPDYLDPNDVTPLINGQRYVIQLRPIHVEDNRIDRGPWTDDFFATPRRCGDLPEIPDDVRVLGGDSKLIVSWDRCSGTRSHIQWRPIHGTTAGQWSSYVDVGTDNTYEIDGLENGVEYDVRVRSALSSSSGLTDEDGNPYRTDWSTPVKDSPTSACPAGESIVPEDFVVLPGNGKLFVSWRPCPDHRYELASRNRTDTSNANWPDGDWDRVDIDGHTIGNLTNGTRYEVRVRSIRTVDGQSEPPSDSTGSYVAAPLDPLDDNRSPGWTDVPRRLSVVENRNYDNPIATIEAADPDRRDEIRYEIIPPFADLDLFPFAINVKDGHIYLYDQLDYEKLDETGDGYTEFELTVRATDLEGVEIEEDIEIKVIDAEGPPTPIMRRVCSTDTGVNVAWGSNATKYRFELQHRPLSTFRFSPHNLIELDSTTYTTTAFGSGSTHVFRVRAIDNLTGEQSKWSSEESVFIGGTTNNPPKFRREDWAFEVVEEQPSGVHIGFVVANDEDRYSSLRFEILESTPENAPFAVDPFTGAITTAGRLDFEEQDSYTLVLSAADLCGSRDYADVTITVVDDPTIDATPLIPNAPTIIERHEQVIVLWPTNYEDTYDLDWRKVNGEYLSRPEDTDATMPRVVDLPDPNSSYAFRLRRVNPLGEIGDWSEETIVDPNVPAPSIEPVDVPRQGQVLGGVEIYIPGITMQRGQAARLGFNMFGIDGQLDNSLIDRRDMHVSWRITDGDISDDSARVVNYTAPDEEGVYDISIVVKQTVPGGIVQRNLELKVHVVGDNKLIKPYQSGDEVPRNFEVDGIPYGAISYFQPKEYRPPEASKALFKVREKSIPSFDWIGINVTPGDQASTVQWLLDGHTAVGDIFTANFVARDGSPIINMSFTSSAAMCLPLPVEWTHSLQSFHVMRLNPDGEAVLMDLPVRFQPDPTFNDPALVCGHSSLFDGQIILAIANEDIVTPTPEPTPVPTATETPTPTPTVEPTAVPTDTPTATPTTDTSTIVVSTSTHTPTATVVPPTATYTPTAESAPTDTPVPTATLTSTPTPEPAPTKVPPPQPTATSVPTDTPVPTATVAPADTPTATALPTHTPTATPEPTHTPVPVVVPPTNTPVPPMLEPEEPGPPSEEEESREFGIVPLILIAAIALVIIGATIVSFGMYNRRIHRHAANAPKAAEQPEALETSASPPPEEDDPEPDDEDEDSPGSHDRLRYDS